MAPLNENQKLYMWLGIAICVAMGLYPPWKFVTEVPAPFAFLYMPPATAGIKLDITRLVVEWCIVAFVTGGLIVSNQKPPLKPTGSKAADSKATDSKATDSKSAELRSSDSRSANSTSANQTADTTASGLRTAPAADLGDSKSATSGISPTPPAVAMERPNAAKNTASGASKSIKFPDFSVGEVLIESDDDPDYWDGIGEARGVVNVPENSNVQLEALKERPMHLRGLKEMDANALQSIDFSESEVTDEDLNYIVHFSKLYELDLSQTKIGDDGIEHIAQIKSLKKLWLDNTKITEESLANLQKLSNLTKISLTGTDITESSIKAAKAAFPPNCEIIMASGIPA